MKCLLLGISFASLLYIWLLSGTSLEMHLALVTQKWFSLYIFVAIALPIVILWAGVCKRAIGFSWADGCVGLFAGWVIWGATMHQNLPLLNEQSIKMVSLAGVYAIFRLLPIGKNRLFIALAIALSLCAVWQSVWGLGQLYGWFAVYHNLFPVTGSFFNPAPLACFLAMASVGLVMLYFYRQTVGRWGVVVEWGIFIAIMIVVSTLPVTYSRAGWIAATVGLFPLLWFKFGSTEAINQFITNPWLKKYIKIVLPLAALFVFAVLFFLKSGSAIGRLVIWKSSALMFLDHPFTGVGMGGWLSNYGKYQMQYFEMGYGTATEKLMAGNVQYSYNEAITLLCETGLVGFLLFAAVLYFALRPTVKLLFSGEKDLEKLPQVAMFGMILAYLTFAMFSFPFSDAVSSALFFALLGMSQCEDKVVR